MATLQQLMQERAARAQVFKNMTHSTPQDIRKQKVINDIKNINAGIRHARLNRIETFVRPVKNVGLGFADAFKNIHKVSQGINEGMRSYTRQVRRR